MKTIIALGATAIALAVGAGTAAAQTPTDRKVAALQKQVAALQKQNAALVKRVVKLEEAGVVLTLAVAASIVYEQCLTAVTADAFAGTWNVVDQIAQATQAGKVYLGPQAAVSDFTSCSTLNIARQQTVPPSVSVFSALSTLLGE